MTSPSGGLPRAPTVPMRRGIVQILWGPHSFRKIVLDPGQSITIGRTDRADVVVDDPKLSGLHFSIWYSGFRAIVRDLESQSGTFINGQHCDGAAIEYGGFIVAGGTTFQLFLEGFTSPVEDPPTVEHLGKVKEAKKALGASDGQLYAVMDAARDQKILWMMQESVDEHRTLYEGQEGRVLDDVAPYLVRFSSDSDLVDRLLLGGWGNAWGFYFRSSEHPKEVRRHLRRFLMAQREETLEKLYFRFYDPRVLREFIDLATPRQRAEMLAGFEPAIVEGPEGEVLLMTPGDGGDNGEAG